MAMPVSEGVAILIQLAIRTATPFPSESINGLIQCRYFTGVGYRPGIEEIIDVPDGMESRHIKPVRHLHVAP